VFFLHQHQHQLTRTGNILSLWLLKYGHRLEAESRRMIVCLNVSLPVSLENYVPINKRIWGAFFCGQPALILLIVTKKCFVCHANGMQGKEETNPSRKEEKKRFFHSIACWLHSCWVFLHTPTEMGKKKLLSMPRWKIMFFNAKKRVFDWGWWVCLCVGGVTKGSEKVYNGKSYSPHGIRSSRVTFSHSIHGSTIFLILSHGI